MAVACSRCGTMNPDGNQFCQSCGTPLVAAAVAGPPAAMSGPPAGIPGPPAPPPASMSGPPPGAAPPGYQSPYYAPGVGALQNPVHRTPWMIIIAAVVGLLLIMAACGTAIAVLGHHASNSGSGLGGALPTPTPAGSPSPLATPSPTSGGGNVSSNPTLSVTVPAGWTIENKDDQTITLVNPNGDGSVTIGSGAQSPPQTAQQNKDTLDGVFTNKYPDTKECPGSSVTNGSLNGVNGIFWELCFTLTSGGQGFQAGLPVFAGANADGSVYYAVILLTPVTNMDAFITQAKPILQSIQWKLK